MDALIEIVLQLVFEVFGELLLTILTKIMGFFFKKIDTHTLLRKRLKFVLTYIFIGLIMVLVVISLIYSKTFLAVISLSYMLFQIIMTLLEIINVDRKNHPLVKLVKMLKKISHYVYPIVLIVFSNLYLENKKAAHTIIILSILGLIIWSSIDGYKRWKHREITKA